MLLRFAVIVLLTANIGLWIWHKQLNELPELSSLGQQPETPSVPANVPSIDVVLHASDESTQCSSFGPLRTQLEQQRAVDRIRTFAQTVWIRDSRSVVERGWWVFMPAEDNRNLALKQAEAIAEAGIDDYFIVTAGDMENTISLGLYADEKHARERQAIIQGRGFDAEIGLRREPEPRYWVDYRLDPNRRDLGRILLRAFPEAVRVNIPCPGSPASVSLARRP